MAGTGQTHKTTRRGIVKSPNQAGFLPKGLTPSVDGSPNFLRRSESEPFPKFGRLIRVSSDISRTSLTVFRSAARRAFWILVENNTRSIGVSSGSSGVGASIGELFAQQQTGQDRCFSRRRAFPLCLWHSL